MLQAGSVEVVYRFTAPASRNRRELRPATRKEESRGRESGDRKKPDSEAANTTSWCEREQNFCRTNIHVSAMVAPVIVRLSET